MTSDFALVGLFKPCQNDTFSGLALDANLKLRNAEAHCGVQVINLHTSDGMH